MYAEKH